MGAAIVDPLPLHLTSRVAPELYDRILDNLHDSPSALSACSTVWRSWLPTCRYHLFSEVVLSQKFATFLRSRANQEVIPFIRKVIINGGWGDPNGKSEEDLFLLLGDLENLACLRMNRVVTWETHDLWRSVTLTAAGTPLSHRLSSLILRSVHFPSFSALALFISTFYNLRELSVEGVTWGSNVAHIEEGQLPPLETSVLKKLRIASCSFRPIILWIWPELASGRVIEEDHLTPPRLTHLALPEIFPNEGHLLGSLLRTLGASLENLEIGFLSHGSDNSDDRDMFSLVDLSYNTQLKTIACHQVVLFHFPFRDFSTTAFQSSNDLTSRYRWVTDILGTIQSRKILQVTFHVWLSAESQLDLINWSALIRILLSPPLAELRHLRFSVSGIGRDIDLVEVWFRRRFGQMLSSKAKLQVEFSE